MTQAEILQNILLNDMFRRLTDYSDKELSNVKQCAIELRDGKYYKAINAEMSRRNREL